MKKTLIAVAAAAALTATSAFAEITFGSWIRVLAAPVASDGEDVVAGMTNSWGYGARTARIDINGVSEDGKAGFIMGVYGDVNDAYGLGDNHLIWVKPVDMVKLSVGKFDSSYNGLRGDFCYGSWNWMRPDNRIVDDEGLTFSGVSAGSGLEIEVTPIEGLMLMANVPLTVNFGGETADDKGNPEAATKAEDTYKSSQIALAYSIDGIGKFKAQWIGKNKTTTVLGKDYDYTGDVEVAFDLTAVENLYATVGAAFGIMDSDYDADTVKTKVAAGVSYQFSDAFKLSVSGGVKIFNDDCLGKKGDEDKIFFAGAGVDYVLMDGLTANADIRFASIGYGKDGDDSSIAFLVGVNKSVSSNGSLGVGFQGATNGVSYCNGSLNDISKDSDSFIWAIPVSVSIWF